MRMVTKARYFKCIWESFIGSDEIEITKKIKLEPTLKSTINKWQMMII